MWELADAGSLTVESLRTRRRTPERLTMSPSRKCEGGRTRGRDPKRRPAPRRPPTRVLTSVRTAHRYRASSSSTVTAAVRLGTDPAPRRQRLQPAAFASPSTSEDTARARVPLSRSRRPVIGSMPLPRTTGFSRCRRVIPTGSVCAEPATGRTWRPPSWQTAGSTDCFCGHPRRIVMGECGQSSPDLRDPCSSSSRARTVRSGPRSRPTSGRVAAGAPRDHRWGDARPHRSSMEAGVH